MDLAVVSGILLIVFWKLQLRQARTKKRQTLTKLELWIYSCSSFIEPQQGRRGIRLCASSDPTGLFRHFKALTRCEKPTYWSVGSGDAG